MQEKDRFPGPGKVGWEYLRASEHASQISWNQFVRKKRQSGQQPICPIGSAAYSMIVDNHEMKLPGSGVA